MAASSVPAVISTVAVAAAVDVDFVGVVGKNDSPSRIAEMSVLNVAVAGNVPTEADSSAELGALVLACHVTFDRLAVQLIVLLLSMTHAALKVGVVGVLTLIW